MGRRGSRRATAVHWLSGCAGLLLGAAPLCAQVQPQDSADLDPSAPLDPMPDLGVEWPDLEMALSDKDARNPTLKDQTAERLPRYESV